MYTFSKRLKLISIALMVLGAVALVSGFLSAPDTVEQAKAMVADAHGHGSHDAHHTDTHAVADHHEDTHEDSHGDAHA